MAARSTTLHVRPTVLLLAGVAAFVGCAVASHGPTSPDAASGDASRDAPATDVPGSHDAAVDRPPVATDATALDASAVTDVPSISDVAGEPALDAPAPDDTAEGIPPDGAATPTDVFTIPLTTSLDLHDVTLFDNPADLADWPVTTTITDVEFQYMGGEGVHVEFSRLSDPGSWPDVTPPGWDGSLQYTLGLVEHIDGQWYGSAAIQFWRGLPASGGNLAEDVVTMGPCGAFGHGSSCQIARNWYYDGRWGDLEGYQPATGETIGVFVVAGNVRGVTDGSQSPVRERSNIVLVSMPDFGGAIDTF